MRILFLFLFSILLTACATPNSTTNDLNNLDNDSCTYQLRDITNSNEIIESSYTCPSSSPAAKYAPNECSWVKTYTHKDGTVVSGHTRCKYNLPPISSYSTPDYSVPSYSIPSSPSSSSAPCVTGYCGPVHVRGYYRKDGTYVRPHTRSRPR